MERDALRSVPVREAVFTRELEGRPLAWKLFGHSVFLVCCRAGLEQSTPVLLELDAASGVQLASIAIPLASVRLAFISRDASLVACTRRAASTSAHRDEVHVFRRVAENGLLQLLYTLPGEVVLGFGAQNDSLLITAATPFNDVFSLREAATGALVRTLSSEERMRADLSKAHDMRLSPDCTQILTIMPYRAVRPPSLFQIDASGSCKHAYALQHDLEDADDACFSAEGRNLFVAYKSAMAIHDVRTGDMTLSRDPAELDGEIGRFSHVDSSPDGGLLLSATVFDNASYDLLQLWRADTMEVVCELRTTKDSCGVASFSADGTRVFDIGFDENSNTRVSRVRVWDISIEHAAYSPLALPTAPPSLSRDLLQLLRSGAGCDVTLVASCGARFPAHRFILSLRSEKLRVQLAGAFSDSAAAELPVPAEFSAHCVQQLLQFMYADTLELHSMQDAKEQLAAADYFRVARLQSLAEAALARGLTSQNAAEILMFAERYNAFGLRDVALRYISRFAALVMRSDGWAVLLAEAPRLAADVCFTSANGRPPTRDETADARAAAVRAGAAGTAAPAEDVPAAADGAGAPPGDAPRTRKRLR